MDLGVSVPVETGYCIGMVGATGTAKDVQLEFDRGFADRTLFLLYIISQREATLLLSHPPVYRNCPGELSSSSHSCIKMVPKR